MTRLVVVGHSAELGGAELTLVRTLPVLPESIHPHVVLFSHGPLVGALQALGIPVTVVPMSQRLAQTRRFDVTSSISSTVTQVGSGSLFAAALTRVVRRLDPDVIMGNSLKADLIALPIAKALRRPLIWNVHDRITEEYLPPRIVGLFRALARRVDLVMVNSAATGATLPGVRRRVVAFPGLTPNQIRPLGPREVPSEAVVGMLGRIAPTKGQDVFVRAAALVAQTHPSARFRIVGSAMFGDHDYEARLHHLVAELGIANQVEFSGFAPDPTAALDSFAVCVHASAPAEPFGQVITEAMARQVPVVATRGGGVDEILEPDGIEPLGLLVPPGSPEALADAIRDVLDDPAVAHERAERAWHSVSSRFSISRTASQWAAAITAVTRPGPAPASARPSRPRVAIAHDYLTQRGGAERVVLHLARTFPDAPIYTTLYDPDGTFPEFADRTVVVSPLNRSAVLRRSHRMAFPLLAPAVNRTHIDADVVIVSSSGWAHGVQTTGAKVVYCHSPARWLYLTDQYLGQTPPWAPSALAVRLLGPALRRWDRASAASADRYLAVSTVIQDRIKTAYGIDAEIVHPPQLVDPHGAIEPVPDLADWGDADGYYLVVSRLLPYKNVPVVVEAFRGRPRRLVVVGSGPGEATLRADLPDNVRLLTDLTDAGLRAVYAGARGLIAPSHEDFGLTPLEALAFGAPTIALRAGGYLDTVVEGRTGVFFDDVTPEAVWTAVCRAEETAFDPDDLAQQVARFSPETFAERIRAIEADVRSPVRRVADSVEGQGQ